MTLGEKLKAKNEIKKPHKKRGSGKKNMKLYVATQNHYSSSE